MSYNQEMSDILHLQTLKASENDPHFTTIASTASVFACFGNTIASTISALAC
ncbi:hypothetical protein MUN88_06690 [Gracilibacillus caseinilyticus]|uniref:Type 2 lantibiotic n=1 Tax=Gracilibacillus caseinilyticus TaxID=2932256 RepID=A0ABY4EZC8_9BACI|nr:hypothetical protein [Gracilibacillus caseinilyticus]UOQ49761.1 hypothetical protein MUN88_06690 [Gracilibacillus caseinilyticus]